MDDFDCQEEIMNKILSVLDEYDGINSQPVINTLVAITCSAAFHGSDDHDGMRKWLLFIVDNSFEEIRKREKSK